MKFALLDPRPGAENEMLDSVCLGVEVTIPKLANRCKLGNLDGQHGTGISRGEDCCVDPPEWRGHPAVLLAARGHGDCAFTLNDGEFDVGDVTLVTVRPDVDSIAAMAVIVLRKTRLFQSTYLGLDRRVNRIAMSDSFAAGLLPWRSRPLPSREDMWAHGLASVSDTEELSTLAVLCSPWRGQTEVPLEMRVAVTAMWLMFGPPKDGAWESREAREYASIINTACGVDNMLAAVYLGAWVQARRTRMALVDAIESGEIVPRLWDARGRFVIVESAHPGALRVGYCMAPVVLAATPPTLDGTRKYTIASHGRGYLDRDPLLALLVQAEPGWGGSPTILGSPQSSGSRLDLADVADMVARAVRWSGQES